MDIDRYAYLESPLQRWDPRFKLAAMGALILTVATVHSIPVSLLSFLLAVALLRVSRLPVNFVVNGVQFAVVLLTPLLVILPLTYPSATDATFAMEGFRLGMAIMLKALAIVLIAYSVFGTSRFDVSMVALQRLKCPSVVVQIILFTYRYIFVFFEELKRMETGMKSRGFVPKTNAETLRIFGNFVGTLLIRSFERTDRVYKAMLSKGYAGQFHSMVSFAAQRKDHIKAGMAVLVAIALIISDNYFGWPRAELGWL